MTVEFQTIRRNAVVHDAIDTIKRMIVRGDLQAGQRLPAERDLAAQLGLSRPSLREAIRALIALNILESRHGEGTFVSSLEPPGAVAANVEAVEKSLDAEKESVESYLARVKARLAAAGVAVETFIGEGNASDVNRNRDASDWRDDVAALTQEPLHLVSNRSGDREVDRHGDRARRKERNDDERNRCVVVRLRDDPRRDGGERRHTQPKNQELFHSATSVAA